MGLKSMPRMAVDKHSTCPDEAVHHAKRLMQGEMCRNGTMTIQAAGPRALAPTHSRPHRLLLKLQRLPGSVVNMPSADSRTCLTFEGLHVYPACLKRLRAEEAFYMQQGGAPVTN